MNASMVDALAAQEARALMARLAQRGEDEYERAMLACLATAQQALNACTQVRLLQALARELSELAVHCRRDVELLERQAIEGPGGPPRELEAARRVARAAHELSELAWMKASQAS